MGKIWMWMHSQKVQKLSSCWDGWPFRHYRHGPKCGGCCAPFRGGAGSPSNSVAWTEAYLRTKWYPDPAYFPKGV